MKLNEIKEILNAKVICGNDMLEREVSSAFASDMMSDVLAYAKTDSVLLTGLVNPQTIRTALMLDMKGVVFVRAKKLTDDVIALANESGIVVLSTDFRMFETCGKLYAKGLKGSGEVDG
jgi:predicted transcriptional regulator